MSNEMEVWERAIRKLIGSRPNHDEVLRRAGPELYMALVKLDTFLDFSGGGSTPAQ